jgi:hypothetical protein
MDIRTQSLSRRAILSALGASMAAPAFAAAPMANVQVPAVYRFKLGGFECTVVSDGPVGLGPIKADMFKGYTQERIDELLAANFIDKNNFQLDQNALVVNTGEKLVLIDTGMGARCSPICRPPESTRPQSMLWLSAMPIRIIAGACLARTGSRAFQMPKSI